MTGKYCTDCYFMYWIDETEDEMNCCNGNAVPENGAPELIISEPHNCPYYSPKEVLGENIKLKKAKRDYTLKELFTGGKND